MENIVNEMCTDFLMSEVCSRHYAIEGTGDFNAQNILEYCELMDHAILCRNAAIACKEYLNTKNVLTLLSKFRLLGLYDNINIINKLLNARIEKK